MGRGTGKNCMEELSQSLGPTDTAEKCPLSVICHPLSTPFCMLRNRGFVLERPRKKCKHTCRHDLDST